MTTEVRTDTSVRKARPGKFVWFEHTSKETKKAQAFYAEVLGWKVQPWGDPGDSTYDMILAGGTLETMIGGYTAPKSEREQSHWIAYVSVEDVDATAKAAVASGGTVLEAPHDLPGVGRTARIADPQGAELCLFKNAAGDPPDLPSTAPPPSGRFFWNELHTTDPTNALSFHEKVLGFTHQTMDMGPAGAYHIILSKDGVGRGGVTGHLERGVRPHWLPYVAVDDPDATIGLAKTLGAKVLMSPEDIPGIGRFGVLEDPTGAVLAVMKVVPPKPNHGA